MSEDLDAATKLEIYKLVISRYRALISEKEERPLSEIRQRVSPYNDFIRRLRDQFTADMAPYVPRRDLPSASDRAIEYVRQIRTCEFAFTFWVDFPDMERLRIGTPMDKAMLLCALLRALESEDARVVVSRRGRAYVRFLSSGSPALFVPESGSLLAGGDAQKPFADDPPAYSFNDLVYENYEES